MANPSTLDQQLELDSLGILRQTTAPPAFAWLHDADKAFLLDIYLAGELGFSRAYLKKWDRKHPESTLRLSSNSLVTWVTDKKGQPNRMVLTWQGEDIAKVLLQVAKNATRKSRYVPPVSAGAR